MDLWPHFQDVSLALLDMSDVVLVVLTLEITNIKNIRLFLEVADQLGYADRQVRLVLNRADSAYGIRVADVENSIGRKIDHPWCPTAARSSMRSTAACRSCGATSQAPVSEDILGIARARRRGTLPGAATPGPRAAAKTSLFARR